MKTITLLKSLTLTFTLSFASQSFAQLTEAQKEEFYHKGTITVLDESGKEKGHFEVRFMPGADNIKEDAKQHWNHAASLMNQLVTEEFWHDKMMKRFFKGLEYASECSQRGVCAISNHFSRTLEDNEKLTGFGSTAAKLKNWLEFGACCVGCTLLTAWGVTAGPIYSVLAPTGALLFRPIAAGTEALFAGTVWPVMSYSFNGVAYALTKNNEEPKEGDITVTYIPNYFSSDEQELNQSHEILNVCTN
jgi:hypothetical protein